MAIAFDQAATNNGNGVSSNVVTISTAGTNRLLLLWAEMSATGVTSISVAGAGLTWHQALPRISPNNSSANGYIELWYAFAAAQLTSQAITVTYNGGANPQVANVIESYSGTNLTGLDGLGAIGATNTATGNSGASSVAVTTTQTNSQVVGGIGYSLSTATTAGTNQTINAQANEGVGGFSHMTSERQNATTALSNTSVTIDGTFTAGTSWGSIGLEIRLPQVRFNNAGVRPHPFSPGLAR